MPVTFSSYRLGPGQRVSYKTVPPPWDWLLRRENELEPRRSRSQIIFAVLVPPLYVAVQAPALIVTVQAVSIRATLQNCSFPNFFSVFTMEIKDWNSSNNRAHRLYSREGRKIHTEKVKKTLEEITVSGVRVKPDR